MGPIFWILSSIFCFKSILIELDNNSQLVILFLNAAQWGKKKLNLKIPYCQAALEHIVPFMVNNVIICQRASYYYIHGKLTLTTSII